MMAVAIADTWAPASARWARNSSAIIPAQFLEFAIQPIDAAVEALEHEREQREATDDQREATDDQRR